MKFDIKKAANDAERMWRFRMKQGEIRTVPVYDTENQVSTFVCVLLVGEQSYRFFKTFKAANKWRAIRGLPEVDIGLPRPARSQQIPAILDV